jgi:hypothetical protein
MHIKDVKVKLLNAIKKQGNKKTGEPYLFYTANFLDESSNVVRLNLSNQLSVDPILTKKLDNAKEVPCIIDIQIYQSGFNLKGSVVKMVL